MAEKKAERKETQMKISFRKRSKKGLVVYEVGLCWWISYYQKNVIFFHFDLVYWYIVVSFKFKDWRKST